MWGPSCGLARIRGGGGLCLCKGAFRGRLGGGCGARRGNIGGQARRRDGGQMHDRIDRCVIVLVERLDGFEYLAVIAHVDGDGPVAGHPVEGDDVVPVFAQLGGDEPAEFPVGTKNRDSHDRPFHTTTVFISVSRASLSSFGQDDVKREGLGAAGVARVMELLGCLLHCKDIVILLS